MPLCRAEQDTKSGEKEDWERGGLRERVVRMDWEVDGLTGVGSKGEHLCANGGAYHLQKKD